jgi:hypothetical protein
MPSQFTKNATRYRSGPDPDNLTFGQYGAQFDLDTIPVVTTRLELGDNDHNELPHPHIQQIQRHRHARKASLINANVDRSTSQAFATTSGATTSIMPDQLVARPWHVASVTSSEESHTSAATKTKSLLMMWQMEKKKEQPWNNIAAVSLKRDAKAEQVTRARTLSPLLQIGSNTSRKTDSIQGKNLKPRK